MKSNPQVKRFIDHVGVSSHDDGESCRLTLVIPRRMREGRRKQEIVNRVVRLCESLGQRPRVLVGKHVRVLTGICIYRDS